MAYIQRCKLMFLWFLGMFSNPTDVASCEYVKGMGVCVWTNLLLSLLCTSLKPEKYWRRCLHETSKLKANIGKRFGNREFLFCFPNLFVQKFLSRVHALSLLKAILVFSSVVRKLGHRGYCSSLTIYGYGVNYVVVVVIHPHVPATCARLPMGLTWGNIFR